MATEAEIQEAKQLGWKPKDQWKGDPDQWADADTFLEKGRHVLPIMRENNDRLKREVDSQREEIARLKELVDTGHATMEEFKKFHSDEVKRQVAKAKKDLRIEIEQARKDGDIEAVVELQEELDNLNAAPPAETPKEKANGKEKPATETSQEHPDFRPWCNDNPWYGTDMVMTSVADGYARQLIQDGTRLQGKEFYAEVKRLTNEALGKENIPPNKVEGDGGGSGGAGGGGRKSGFDSLPAEARSYAKDNAHRYVGEGKMFKTNDDWFKFYAEQYGD